MRNMVYEDAQASLLSSYSAKTQPTHLAFTAGRSTILTFFRSLSSLCVVCLCKLPGKGGWSQIRRQKNRKHLIAFFVCTVCTAKLGKKYWAWMSCLEAAFNNN
jgi:hypothetical protein